MRTWLTSVTAALCALVLLAGVATVSYRLGEESAAPLTGQSSSGSQGGFAPLAELYRQLSEDAVESPGDDVLIKGAIEGMIDALDDPYAAYFDVEAFRRFNMQLDGSFSGVGMMLEDSPDGPVVVSVLPGTPAERAGIPAGHRIVAVDGEDVRGLPLSAIVNLVTGEAGTNVTLSIEDPEGGGSQRFELTREEIDLPLVEGEMLDGVGHVHLLGFSHGAADRTSATIEDLLEQGAKGIILDLRSNPGGLLNISVDVASLFLPRGELVVSVQEAGEGRRELRSGGGPYEELPMVVLVDESSASASEILAGALQDADRAEIIGVPTFGKGTVQSVRTLPDGAGVKFTTAAYFTPSGDSIEEVGVQPDRRVEDPDEQLVAGQEALRAMIARLTPAA